MLLEEERENCQKNQAKNSRTYQAQSQIEALLDASRVSPAPSVVCASSRDTSCEDQESHRQIQFQHQNQAAGVQMGWGLVQAG